MPKIKLLARRKKPFTPPPAGDDAGRWFYRCTHGAANIPCSICFPDAPVVPDTWMETYTPPAPPVPGATVDPLEGVI